MEDNKITPGELVDVIPINHDLISKIYNTQQYPTSTQETMNDWMIRKNITLTPQTEGSLLTYNYDAKDSAQNVRGMTLKGTLPALKVKNAYKSDTRVSWSENTVPMMLGAATIDWDAFPLLQLPKSSYIVIPHLRMTPPEYAIYEKNMGNRPDVTQPARKKKEEPYMVSLDTITGITSTHPLPLSGQKFKMTLNPNLTPSKYIRIQRKNEYGAWADICIKEKSIAKYVQDADKLTITPPDLILAVGIMPRETLSYHLSTPKKMLIPQYKELSTNEDTKSSLRSTIETSKLPQNFLSTGMCIMAENVSGAQSFHAHGNYTTHPNDPHSEKAESPIKKYSIDYGNEGINKEEIKNAELHTRMEMFNHTKAKEPSLKGIHYISFSDMDGKLGTGCLELKNRNAIIEIHISEKKQAQNKMDKEGGLTCTYRPQALVIGEKCFVFDSLNGQLYD